MGLGLRELLVILLIVLVVFGTKRLIGAGGDLGKAIQSFRKGMRDAQEPQDDPAKLEPPANAPPPAAGSGASPERRENDRPGA
ncbi:MAG TPA: twin-arginine translocase subunit TatA [Xanthomonadaceae bacterium]|jgi:sec-independent protein translocase protein TatA|nr:twin-arginine translocase subunit TatA [Xanthomonadaceae bacterium]